MKAKVPMPMAILVAQPFGPGNLTLMLTPKSLGTGVLAVGYPCGDEFLAAVSAAIWALSFLSDSVCSALLPSSIEALFVS